MPYSPKTWNLADPITQSDLARIETGIDEATATAEAAATAADLAAFEATLTDTGWVTNGTWYAQSGWAIDSVKYRKVGQVVYIWGQVSRTGANISAGNFANQSIIQTPNGTRPSSRQALAAGAGPITAMEIDASGYVVLSASATDINTGYVVIFGGCYIL